MKLQSFLYLLLRDHVVAGEVEKLVIEVEAHPGPNTFSNPYLESYAKELSARLTEGKATS
jgi:hypothetical protein